MSTLHHGGKGEKGKCELKLLGELRGVTPLNVEFHARTANGAHAKLAFVGVWLVSNCAVL